MSTALALLEDDLEKPTSETPLEYVDVYRQVELERTSLIGKALEGELSFREREIELAKSIADGDRSLQYEVLKTDAELVKAGLDVEQAQLDAQTGVASERILAEREIALAYIDYLGTKGGAASEQFSPMGAPYVTVQAPAAEDYSGLAVIVGLGLLAWWVLS